MLYELLLRRRSFLIFLETSEELKILVYLLNRGRVPNNGFVVHNGRREVDIPVNDWDTVSFEQDRIVGLLIVELSDIIAQVVGLLLERLRLRRTVQIIPSLTYHPGAVELWRRLAAISHLDSLELLVFL